MANEAIVSSFEIFSEKFPELAKGQADSKRMKALKRYFSQNMVLSLGSMPKDGNWPEIAYPTPMKLKKDLERLEKLQKDLSKRETLWKNTLSRAKLEGLSQHVKKFVEPAYWKHLSKYFSDKDYRSDADAVQLPVHLVSHKRYKPMVEMFVNNLDYRKQLTETVQNSIVYKDNKKLGRYADDLNALRTEQSQRTINQTQKMLSDINAEIDMYREILSWAKK